jgi:predicted nucleotidyltransferase
MTVRLDLSPEHQRIVLQVLAEHLPLGCKVWVFGSRATGRARRYSDLDLAIDAGRRLTIDETAILREAFDECDLPCKVDIVDWHVIDDRFRRLIAGERVALPEAARDGGAVPGAKA